MADMLSDMLTALRTGLFIVMSLHEVKMQLKNVSAEVQTNTVYILSSRKNEYIAYPSNSPSGI